MAGVRSIMEAARGEYAAKPRVPAAGQRGMPIFTLLIFLFVALIFAGALSWISGAVVGALGLPAIAKLSFPALGLPILGGIALVGVIAGLLVHAVFSGGQERRTAGGGGPGGGDDGCGGFLTGFFLSGRFSAADGAEAVGSGGGIPTAYPAAAAISAAAARQGTGRPGEGRRGPE